jgi:hypothetical protein
MNSLAPGTVVVKNAAVLKGGKRSTHRKIARLSLNVPPSAAFRTCNARRSCPGDALKIIHEMTKYPTLRRVATNPFSAIKL